MDIKIINDYGSEPCQTYFRISKENKEKLKQAAAKLKVKATTLSASIINDYLNKEKKD